MGKQKTAMQQLIDYMRENFYLTDRSEDEFTDSLAMEKEQIENAFEAGQNDCSYSEGILYNSSGDDYYKSNFYN